MSRETLFRSNILPIGVRMLLSTGLLAGQLLANDLAPLSDEFDHPSTIADWQRVHLTEQWNADQLEAYDIDTTQPGRMVMMPYTVSWFANYRGPLSFKDVTGDFVITTDVRATGRDGQSIPQAQYSLAGIMIRTPRNITPQTWTPGGENYVFLSLGHGDNGGASYQFEVKTTINSNSTLNLSPSPANNVQLQVARLGPYVITLRREPGQPWVVHRRYLRNDFPATLQVGLVTYTDWLKAQIFTPFVHNSNVLDPPLPPGVNDPNPNISFSPDLIAGFDYARYYRPTLPPHLVGADLANAIAVPDAELLAFLGENANVPANVPALGSGGMAIMAISLVLAFAFVLTRATGSNRRLSTLSTHGPSTRGRRRSKASAGLCGSEDSK